MKTVKFRDYLVPMVRDGRKKTTWRLFDDKELTVGDYIELRQFGHNTGFATAVITEVVEKKLREMDKVDFELNASFQSSQAMYATFSEWYGRPVDGDTIAKIIHFRLLPGNQ